MSADLRLQAAREYLTYARKVQVADLPPSLLVRMAAELRRQLGQVLDVAAEQQAADHMLSPAVGVLGDDAGRLAVIREVLARVLHDGDADRQYALEEIERIAGGEDQ